MSSRFLLKNVADTRRFAQSLVPLLKKSDTFCLFGDLGAGKSEFARWLIRDYLSDNHADVPSPTFSLLQTYINSSRSFRINHFDLYRLDKESIAFEFLQANLSSGCDAVNLIEWPSRLGTQLPSTRLDLALHYIQDDARSIPAQHEGAEDTRRILTVTFHGNQWKLRERDILSTLDFSISQKIGT
eukprot:GILI01039375.1.p1 GENE.GILI01039375.1~~GILI01039375.1.p1  ORF type:complete len:185 (+),score=4.88 GILI01039375.1:62-616(+)